jgi:hypothetical protein
MGIAHAGASEVVALGPAGARPFSFESQIPLSTAVHRAPSALQKMSWEMRFESDLNAPPCTGALLLERCEISIGCARGYVSYYSRARDGRCLRNRVA